METNGRRLLACELAIKLVTVAKLDDSEARGAGVAGKAQAKALKARGGSLRG